MLKSLSCINFKKLENFSVNFTSGSNVICGANGAGKSSLFHAILFGLYGSAAVPCSKENLPSWGTKDCEVTLTTHKFIVTRTLRNCTVTTLDGELLAKGHSPCNDYISEVLGMDYRAFSIFAMSQQGETQALLTLGVTELNRRVENYSGVEIIDKIIKSASKDATYLAGETGSKELVDIETLELKLGNLVENLSEFEQLSDEVAEKIAKTKNSLVTLREIYTSSSIRNQKIHEAQRQSGTLKQAIQGNLEKINTLVDLMNVEPPPIHDETLLGNIREGIKDNKISLENLQQLKHSREALESEVKGWQKNVDLENKAKIALACLMKQSEEIENEAEKASIALTKVTHHYDSIESLISEATCPTCHRAFEDTNPERLKKDLVETGIAMSEAETRNRVARKAHRENAKTVSNLLSQVGGYSELQAWKQLELDKLPAYNHDETVALAGFIDAHQGKLEELIGNKTAYQNYQEKISIYTQQHSDYTEQNLLAENELAKTVEISLQSPEDLSQLEADGKELNSCIEKYEKAKDFFATDIADTKASRDTVAKQVIDARMHNDLLKEKLNELDQTNSLVTLLRDNRQNFMKTVWDRILTASTAFISDATDDWITGLGRDDNGNFTYSEGGNPVPVAGCASGAQKAFLGVSLRLGLAQALHGNHPLLLLDEPTEAMSEENAEKLANSLLQLGGQTIFITHRESDLLTAKNIIVI